MTSCNSGCTFIRFFASSELSSTAPKNFDEVKFISVGGEEVSVDSDDSEQFVPDFVTITNGNSTVLCAQLSDLFVNPTLMFGNEFGMFELFDRMVHSGLAPKPVLNATVCDAPQMRERIQNSLADAPSKNGYLASLGVWAALLCWHDVAVLSGHTASTTRTIRCVALIPEIFAVIFAFLWSMGVAGAFVAKDGAQGCYYEMPTLAAMFAVSTPALLLKKSWDDIFLMGCTLIHGDFLCSAKYFVPWPLTVVALPGKPSFPVLPALGTSPPHRRPTQKPENVQKKLVDVLFTLNSISTASTIFVVIAFGSYSLFAKTMMVAHHGVHNYLADQIITQDVLIAVFAFFGLLLAPLYSLFQAYGLLLWKFQEVVMTKVQLDNLGAENQDVRRARQQFMLDFCVIGITLSPIFNSVSTVISLLLSYPQNEEFNSELACLWGEIGFYYAWMIAASYRPFGTPWHALALVLNIKCKRMSTFSLTVILALHAKYPQFGLDTEGHAVISILEQHIKKGTPVRMRDPDTVKMRDPDTWFASHEGVITGLCEDLLNGVIVSGKGKPVLLHNLYIPFIEDEWIRTLDEILMENEHQLRFLPCEAFEVWEESQSLQRRLLDDQ